MKASEILDQAVDTVIADWQDPATRVYYVTTMATSAVCSKMGMRFIPSVALAVAAGLAAERIYTVIDDVHKAALESHAVMRGMVAAQKEMLGAGPRAD